MCVSPNPDLPQNVSLNRDVSVTKRRNKSQYTMLGLTWDKPDKVNCVRCGSLELTVGRVRIKVTDTQISVTLSCVSLA